ncbi:MAG: response regulator [Myxococcales bacterium]|jgi:DNA-binding NtrC family response regulator
MAATATVMLVDDEEMVLTSLGSFLTLETDYAVESFTSPPLALDHLREHEVDVVISDFMMPEMDGLQFLIRARELKPDVPRIILTGYADKENVIKAINTVGLYQYIEKPWDNDELHLVVRNAIEKRQLGKSLAEKLRQIDGATDELRLIQQDILKAFV